MTMAIHASWADRAPLWSAELPAGIEGTVLGPGDSGPRAGLRVVLDGPDGRHYRSESTDADGRFRLTGVAPGNYRVTIVGAAGVYPVAAPVTVSAGEIRRLHLALLSDEPTPGVAGIWQRPFLASLLVVGGAIVVGVLVQEITKEADEPAVSPF